MIKSFTSTAFQRNPADVFNAVQSDKIAQIAHKARPKMVVMLESEQLALVEKVRQLTELIKKTDGDSHKQADLLK